MREEEWEGKAEGEGKGNSEECRESDEGGEG